VRIFLMLTPLLMLGNNDVWHHDMRHYMLRLHMTGIGVSRCLVVRRPVPGCLMALPRALMVLHL